MRLPNAIPEYDPAGLWVLQLELIGLAERLLGERDRTKTIYQPTFHEHGPRLRNTPTLDGAFVELGEGSKTYWPTVVYEMAHETIHLLNPTAGSTNWLEEGVAVEFSIYAQQKYDVVMQAPTSGPYFQALQMVRALPRGTFPAASRVREAAISLSVVTIEQLCTLFPEGDPTVLRPLVEKGVPR